MQAGVKSGENRVIIKICGIKTLEEVEIINRYPINHIGLIFAPSKRQVSEDTAKTLVENLRKDIEPVGVFVNESLVRVNELIKTCGLKLVQLHGEESVDYCKKVRGRVWKSFSIKDADSLKRIPEYTPYVEGILLDTYHEGEKGGTGKVFNWELVKELSAQYRIILAGGLTPDNVMQAIKTVQPQVVDLNSGLETNLIKDETKIKTLFENLKASNII